MNVDIIMKSNLFEVIKINKKTTAKFFKNLIVGDILQFSIPIKYAGTSRGRTYSSYIKITNINNNDFIEKSFNEIGQRFDGFKLKEIKND